MIAISFRSGESRGDMAISRSVRIAVPNINVDAEATPDETASTPAIMPNFDLRTSIIVDALRDRFTTPIGRKPTGQCDFSPGPSTATIGCGGLTCFIKSLFHWPSTLRCASAPSSAPDWRNFPFHPAITLRVVGRPDV